MKRRMYYDLYHDGEMIGKFTTDEIAEMIGVSAQTVQNHSSRGTPIKRDGEEWFAEPGMPRDFFSTWPAACERARLALELGARCVHG